VSQIGLVQTRLFSLYSSLSLSAL